MWISTTFWEGFSGDDDFSGSVFFTDPQSPITLMILRHTENNDWERLRKVNTLRTDSYAREQMLQCYRLGWFTGNSEFLMHLL